MTARDALYYTSYMFHAKIELEEWFLEEDLDNLFNEHNGLTSNNPDLDFIKLAARQTFSQAEYVLKLKDNVQRANEWLNG